MTEKEVRNAKPGAKVMKLYDRDGLLLRIRPNGSKTWEFKYRVHGADGRLKEKSLSLGTYAAVSLKEAREKCQAARKQRSEGLDPALEKRRRKQAARFEATNTFGVMAAEWKKVNEKKWCDDHAERTWRRIELHLLPVFGNRAIGDISALDLLDHLQTLEAENKTETVHRLLQICRGIFQLAVLTRRAQYNPAFDLHGALRAHKEKHHPSIGASELPDFFSALERSDIALLTKLAIKFLMLTFVRQGELRHAMWRDITSDATEWRIRAETTKMRVSHIVPLSSQAQAVLDGIRQISGSSAYIFPTQQGKKHPVMSENTINKALRRMGYEGKLVGHGFRSVASTILNEHEFPPDVIERQLAHMPRDQVRAAYNRAQHLSERRRMMNWWGDYLEKSGLVAKKHLRTITH